MPHIPQHSTTLDQQRLDSLSATAVRRLVTHDIRTPLDALRACLESLTESDDSLGDRELLRRALEQLRRVELAAEVLCESAHPSKPFVVRCTVEEIARSACSELLPEERGCLRLAIESPACRVDVDGPLLSRSLARILRGAIGDGAKEILLHSRTEAETLEFAITDDLDPSRHLDLERSFEPGSEHADRAEIALAARDIRRIGGSLERTQASRGYTSLRVRVPTASGGRAAR